MLTPSIALSTLGTARTRVLLLAEHDTTKERLAAIARQHIVVVARRLQDRNACQSRVAVAINSLDHRTLHS